MPRRPTLGLIGQIFAILLLTVLIEFAASTWLYERARDVSVRDDEAHRLAEHLVIARKLVSEHPAAERPAMAADLTTNRYTIDWRGSLPPPGPVAPSLKNMYAAVIAWEPDLARSELRLVTQPRGGFIAGGLRLPDKSWLHFSMREPPSRIGLAVGRLVTALVPAIGLILIGGLLLRQMLRPMRRLAAAADKVGVSAPQVESVPEDGPAEVRRVIVAFNAMQARIHTLIADRTEALAAVGHDFRTPLSRLRLRADQVVDDETRGAIHHDVAEMDAMVASLLAYLGGDGDAEKPVSTDLAVMCATIVDNATDLGRDASYDGPDHLETRFRALGIKRAVVNLVENALHYGGSARLSLIDDGDHVLIRIDDDGPGIPDDARATVLQPFVRLDRARSRDTSGFGLGLPIVVRAVEAEAGTLTLTNRAEGGLRAEICLPRR